MTTQNLDLKKALQKLVAFFGEDACREAKNYLHQCLINTITANIYLGVMPEKEEWDRDITLHQTLYDFFDELQQIKREVTNA